MNKLKTVLTILLSLIFYNTFSQAILNTEAMLKEIDSTFAFKLNVDGNMNFGNIELTEIGSSLTLGKKIKNSLVRMSLGYEYISEDKEILSNDWTGQIRYNKFFNKNSVFLFVQGSKIKSLKLDHRYLIGGGYRIRVKENKSNYFDVAAGFFYEDELYEKELNSQLSIHNYRYSFSSFSNVLINEKISLNTSVYYQINSKDFKDKRLFINPRLYFDLVSLKIYLNVKYRHHSTPYVDILKSDSEYTFGFEIDL